jgi:large subunit ribosomal protein L18
MKKQLKKIYLQKKKRFLKKIVGNSIKPRLSVFRSNTHIYAQLIDDKRGQTLIACSTLDKNYEKKITNSATKEASFEVGSELAKRALKKEIKYAIFERGNRKYHGRLKNLAEGARKEGLIF